MNLQTCVCREGPFSGLCGGVAMEKAARSWQRAAAPCKGSRMSVAVKSPPVPARAALPVEESGLPRLLSPYAMGICLHAQLF